MAKLRRWSHAGARVAAGDMDMAGALVSLVVAISETWARTGGVNRFVVGASVELGSTCIGVFPSSEVLLKIEKGGLRGGRLTKGGTGVLGGIQDDRWDLLVDFQNMMCGI
uniref:Uncharacterized protein n=1 Tax=Romanomermis culicivorax TaxID=13658 RepID=A0A915J1A4_ROMCU